MDLRNVLMVAVLDTTSGPCVLVAADGPTSELLAALARMQAVTGRNRYEVGRKVWDACAREVE